MINQNEIYYQNKRTTKYLFRIRQLLRIFKLPFRSALISISVDDLKSPRLILLPTENIDLSQFYSHRLAAYDNRLDFSMYFIR